MTLMPDHKAAEGFTFGCSGCGDIVGIGRGDDRATTWYPVFPSEMLAQMWAEENPDTFGGDTPIIVKVKIDKI